MNSMQKHKSLRKALINAVPQLR
ncbi:phage tail protein, partial [Salmonella enterica subsp. enterica serovar Tennessee]|nr:phage tail protein [Salmonella enterica subsp. enterica serovar Tennessee]EDS5868239.1 phage tail protein [Salmonella enterica subsp. houtenae]EEE2281388.1 phage tail protein [Salmonella enterica subsp. houtenae]EEE5050747.1 phage tail protein [Salmonella enterica subsp. arizonae]